MSQQPDTPGTRRSRQRRTSRRARAHWGRIVVIVLIVLIVAAVAGTSGAIVGVSRTLPKLDDMTRTRLGQNTVLYDRHGRTIAVLHGAVNRVVVRSGQIPQVMKDATVAIEDRRFYEHHGVDFTGIARALYQDLRAGHVVEGASTITQQYVKNAYLSDAQTLTRKLREAVLAWQLEDKWSKDKILTQYLNTAYYGAGAYGVQAASLTYFHKPVEQLTLPQAALLAALPKFPSEYSPVSDPKVVRQRRDEVLDNMAEQGYITAERAASAKARKLVVFDKPLNQRKGPAAYFVDYVTRKLVDRYGARETFEGGLKVYTSLDMRLQNDGIAAIKAHLPSTPLAYGMTTGPDGALVSIDPSTGYIRAMVASTDWRTTKFNVTWQSQRQPGSAMKPFALIAAVEEGANPAATYYYSHPLHIPMPGTATGYWDVHTAEHSSGGRMSLVQATLASDNTVFAQLCLDLGPAKVVAVAKKMGITTPLQAVPSIVLGSEEVNPLEMANAYATMAAGGVRHAPQAIERVVFPHGRVDHTHVKGTRVVSQGVMYVVDKILEQNTSPSGGTAAGMSAYYAGRSAGKTGTTEDSADAWFCGFNPRLATAFWMGYRSGRIPMPGVFGATYGVPIWGTYYSDIFGGTYIPDFAAPTIMPMWKPWTGKYSRMLPSPSPSPSPSASESASGSAQPKPTKTVTAKPSQSPTPTTTPTTTPTQTPTPTGSPKP